LLPRLRPAVHPGYLLAPTIS